MQLMLKVKKLTEDAKLPIRANPNDAGLDIYSDIDIYIDYGEIKKISTGIAVELPYPSVGLLLDRSSLGAKGITIFGGVIDSDYRGEIFVVLYNSDIVRHYIKKGHKIAQLVIFPIVLPMPYEVKELTGTQRGDNGFGSTGA